MIWKRKNKSTEKRTDSRLDKASGYIANLIIKVQSRWANWMLKQSEKLSRPTKLVILISGGLVIFFYCLALVTGSWSGSYHSLTSRSEIKTPVTDAARTKPGLLPVDASVNRVMAFKHYLDSLGTTVKGKIELDSILKNRPGLLDSINQVEKYYNPK